MNEFKLFAKHLAQVSGEIINMYFRSGVAVAEKDDNSPVTIADKKAEEVLRLEIMKEFPDHGILGEEFGEHNPDAEYKWILDPIDGTKSFICGTVTFGTLIALTYRGNPVLGVINQPVLGEFLIGDNESAELNGVKVKIRECNDISKAVLLTTDHFYMHKYQNGAAFDLLAKEAKIYRNWGDCYGYYLLATGYADIMIDPIMHVWDSMAVIPVIRGAGGIITDINGNDPVKGDSIVAASPSLHDYVIKSLA
ncbi:MAG: histidinol-phosphatase [Ignavibacteriaceae bacterium]|nr:histidinol-phosphatase [Ignavibacteriaceae bacterium]